ncbi:uncharacterized protein LOC116249919 [Nymphaea colorata]|nr:uncharacterized protein LOC116249919 [Nymphaea colorata]XP_049932630.1 uncharacterized protein LOC116249919 [Nymphaea colorata]XP_049932631.1 uncharacterized protein LOC116249919 [Nymphaea colorata]
MLSIQNPSDPPCSSEISARNRRKDERTSDQLSLFEADLPTSASHQLELLHFSIRDYVYRARKKDISQNWPFAHPYLQVCLDHGVKDVLPPFEPPDTFHRRYSNREQALVDAHGEKAIESLHEESSDGRRLFLTCIDQVEVADSTGHQEQRRSSKEKRSSVESPPEAQQEGVDTESTITSDNLVGERLLPPKKCRYRPSARNSSDRPPVVVKIRRSGPTSGKGQARKQVVEEEGCCAKAAPRGEDQSSVTGSKEVCLEVKPESSRSEGFCSNLSTLVDPMASKLCPVCREFSSTSNTTLNAHIDQCLALVSSDQITDGIKTKKNKVKPRKIRTMVDIYATARRCTLEELDRLNGTTWAQNTGIVPLAGEHLEERKRPQLSDANSADGSDSGAVYIDSSGTKVRILSQLNDDSINLNSRKPSASDSVERSPLPCIKRSPLSNNAKISRLRPQSKTLSTFTIPGNQIHNKRKRVSLQDDAQGKTRLSGPLKQWVSLKCTGAWRKKIMNDGQHDPTEDNIVQNGDLSTADGSKSISAGLMKNFVPSPSESADTHQDSTNEAMDMGKTLEKKCRKKLYRTSGRKILSMGKNFFSKRSDLPKRVYRFKSTSRVIPADHQEVNSSTGTGDLLEQACDPENGCSRTCDPGLPSSFQAEKDSSLRCLRNSFETDSNKLVDDGDLSKSSELDSVGKSDSTDMAMEEDLVAPKSQADHGYLTDEPVVVDLDAGHKADSQEPITREITPYMEMPLSSLDVVPAGLTSSLASRDPQSISVKPLLLDVNSQCLDSGVQVQLETKLSGLTGEGSSCNIHVTDKVVHPSGQAMGDDMDAECNQYIQEVPASISRVNTSGLQSEASISPLRESTYRDAVLEKPTVGCSSPVMHGYPKLVISHDQHNLLDRYSTQMSPDSSRSSISVPTATRPLLSPGSFPMHSERLEKVNLSPLHCCSEPVRKDTGHLVQVYQPAPPKGILGGQATGSALPLEVSKGFGDAQHCHCSKGSCRGSFSICPSEVMSCGSNSCQMRPPGSVSSRNELDEGMSASISNFTPQYSSIWQPPIGSKVANAHVQPTRFVPKNLQADVTMSRGCCYSPPAESDHGRVQPSPSSVLRLMGKDLMVANNEVDPTELPKASSDSTAGHPNSKYLSLLGFPGAYNANLGQVSSDHIHSDASLVCDHKYKDMQYASSRFSKPHGDFSNFRVCQLPLQSNSCHDIHSGGISRLCFSSGFGSDVQNENFFQKFGPSGSFDAKKLGIARKNHKQVLAPFGAKSSQEIIIIDDSPEPYRTSSVVGDALQREFQENRLSRDAVVFPVLPIPSCSGVHASPSYPLPHDLADGESSIGSQRRLFTSCPGASINSMVNRGNSDGSGTSGMNHFVLRSVAAAQHNPALCYSQRS